MLLKVLHVMFILVSAVWLAIAAWECSLIVLGVLTAISALASHFIGHMLAILAVLVTIVSAMLIQEMLRGERAYLAKLNTCPYRFR